MDDEFYTALGRRIRDLRNELGITQEQLAERTGTVSASYVAHIEAGSRRPRLEGLRAIAGALGVDMAGLFAHDSEELKMRAADRRLLTAVQRLDRRDMALLTTLAEEWASFVRSERKPPRRRGRSHT